MDCQQTYVYSVRGADLRAIMRSGSAIQHQYDVILRDRDANTAWHEEADATREERRHDAPGVVVAEHRSLMNCSCGRHRG